jgi:Ca-activated chloride channel family protein
MDATLLVDHQPLGSPDGASLVRVRALLTLRGDAPPADRRPPLALAFVLDRSGSMAGERLEAARQAAAHAIARLHPADVVSAVAFDDAVLEVAAPAPLAHHPTLGAQLLGIEAGGSTNLSGGWLRGRHHLQAAAAMLRDAPGASRRILLLTDGHANAGITDRDQLVALARQARVDGIGTTTIGVGDGYDDDLLRAMADAGGGNAWYIERADQSQDVFAEELGNLLSVSAQGVGVTLTAHPAVRTVRARSTWPATTTTHDGAPVVSFDLGDLYASEPKPLLVELLVDRDVLGDAAVARLTVRADVLRPDGSIESRTLHLPLAASLEAQEALHPEVEAAVRLAEAAEAREEAARRQRDGDIEGAAFLMACTVQRLTDDLDDVAPEAQELLRAQADDLTALRAQYEAGRVSELDAKYQMQRAYNARRGKRSYDAAITRRRPEPDDDVS